MAIYPYSPVTDPNYYDPLGTLTSTTITAPGCWTATNPLIHVQVYTIREIAYNPGKWVVMDMKGAGINGPALLSLHGSKEEAEAVVKILLASDQEGE